MYPDINPIAFSIGPLKVHWYGLMYLFSFIAGFFLFKYRLKRLSFSWDNDRIFDLLFFVALGVIVGGRMGYMLFYDFPSFIKAPWIIFKVWDGGMSFHGGFLGVLLACLFWCKKEKIAFFTLMDLLAPVIPIGLGAGRLGNFINGYLLGRVTNVPWAVIYRHGGLVPRHPIEIYEFLFEGVFLFIILWVYGRKKRPEMAVSGLFLICYGIFRCVAELFRQPDPQLGFIAFGWLTMGELLSVPMIILGAWLLYLAYHRKRSVAKR